MLREIKQTDKEKLAMYMKLSKRELSEMLIECNKYIDILFSRNSRKNPPRDVCKMSTADMVRSKKYNEGDKIRVLSSPDGILETSIEAVVWNENNEVWIYHFKDKEGKVWHETEVAIEAI